MQYCNQYLTIVKAPRGISPVINRPGSRINELQERGAKIKRALEQFAPPLNSSEIFEQDKLPSAPHPQSNKENKDNINASSLHKLVNERLGTSSNNRLSVSASGFHNVARTPPCTPLKSKNQNMPSFLNNTNNSTVDRPEITVENTVCTSRAPIMEDDMEEDFHESNNSHDNESNVRIQISGSHGDSDFEDEEEQHEDEHEDETEDDERLRQVLCTFFPHSTSVSMDNSEHHPRRAKTFTRSNVSHALDMLCSSPDRRKTNVLNSSTGSLTSLGYPLAHNSYLNTTTPHRRHFQQEDLSLSPLSIKSPITSTPSSIASSTSKDRKDWKKNSRTFSFSSFKK